jgi:hypothetical protein
MPAPHSPGADELARVPLPGLTALALDDPRIPDNRWPRLLAAPWASRLRRLRLHDGTFGTRDGYDGAGMRALAGAPLPALVDLDLQCATLTPADLSGTMASAPWLGQLTRLKLAHEYLGAAGLAALASLRLPRLKCLSLDNVCTTEAGLVALGAAPWLARLTHLEFEEMDEDDARQGMGDPMNAQVCGYILEGRGFSTGNPFAPLAREGFDRS